MIQFDKEPIKDNHCNRFWAGCQLDNFIFKSHNSLFEKKLNSFPFPGKGDWSSIDRITRTWSFEDGSDV